MKISKKYYRFGAIALVGLLAAAIILAIFFYDLDKRLVIYLNLRRTPTLDRLFLAFTYSAGIVTYTTGGLCLLFSLMPRFNEVKNRLRFVILSVIFSGLMATVIKYSVGRIRPYHLYRVIHNLGPGGGYSFPSGHSCDAFVMAAIVALSLPKKYPIILIYCWAVIIGISRVYLGVHYLSDVLAGICVGSSMALFAHYIVYRNSKVQ